MHKMMELKDALCDELNEYSGKRKLSYEDLDVIDKLTHSIKSIETILAMEGYDDEYSRDYEPRYDRGYSYARHRDSMGRYSRDEYSNEDNPIARELKEAMDYAKTDKEKEAIKQAMKELGL